MPPHIYGLIYAQSLQEATAPEGDRSKAQTTQQPLGLDAKVVSPLGQANVPAGYGEGSLWATDIEPISAACDDVVEPGEGLAAPLPALRQPAGSPTRSSRGSTPKPAR